MGACYLRFPKKVCQNDPFFCALFQTVSGRLHEKCLSILAGEQRRCSAARLIVNEAVGADIQFRRHNRLDVCLVQNHPIAL